MRQFLLPQMPQNGQIQITGSEYRYLVQVLRLKVGAQLDGRLPNGSLCALEVTEIERKEKLVTLAVVGDYVQRTTAAGESAPPQAAFSNSFPKIILFQWLLKGQKMDLVIRQATETGVAVVVPVAGARSLSIGAADSRKDERWKRIVREARQQSGSPIATQVYQVISPDQVPAVRQEFASAGNACSLLFTEAPLALKSIHQYLVNGATTVALVNGPEGGLSAEEAEALNVEGFLPVHLKTNILRAETCALYGVAAVQNALTELESWQLKG
ncbi:MAG TPA: 16S rRNA (uracil(1498)-N(3))-methyltransferase [Treponema sp.]|nr:16S rRNA (uracil(1498)-N(3))-methyltransferase [Treponema sp.]